MAEVQSVLLKFKEIQIQSKVSPSIMIWKSNSNLLKLDSLSTFIAIFKHASYEIHCVNYSFFN